MSRRRLRWNPSADLTAFRESGELRRLTLGTFVSGIGTQAGLVALPYQVYVETNSALLTGLLGAAELVPLMAAALVGGALADHYDRRRLLLLDQIALVLVSAVLCAVAIAGDPSIALLYVLAGLLAGAAALQNVARSAIVPNLVTREQLPAAMAVTFGVMQLTAVVGPALGGLIIAAAGVEAAYATDAISCLAMGLGVIGMRPQLPIRADGEPLAIRRSIAEGLRFVRGNEALKGSFAIDLLAMTFGMPRALFPVLAISVYGAGATGTGILFAAVSAGATVAAVTTRWLDHARRLGVVVLGAVAVWGLAIAAAGLMPSLWPAAAMLAVAGAADTVSAVCRGVINQSVTVDAMRGRMSSVFSMVVTSGPRLGDIESGVMAALTSVRFSVVSGGVACVASVVVVAAAYPKLASYDKTRALAIEDGL